MIHTYTQRGALQATRKFVRALKIENVKKIERQEDREGDYESDATHAVKARTSDQYAKTINRTAHNVKLAQQQATTRPVDWPPLPGDTTQQGVSHAVAVAEWEKRAFTKRTRCLTLKAPVPAIIMDACGHLLLPRRRSTGTHARTHKEQAGGPR